MRKTSVSIIILIILSLVILYFKCGKSLDQQNIPDIASSQYKNDCKIFDAQDDESRTYKNELLNFSFVYPENSLVCERKVENYSEDNMKPEMEITVWSKASFMNNVPSSPELIVHINNPDLSLLPASEIISSEQIEISGIKTDKKVQKSSFCTTEDCPTFTSFSLVHQGNNIEIQSWIDSQSILDSFKLN